LKAILETDLVLIAKRLFVRFKQGVCSEDNVQNLVEILVLNATARTMFNWIFCAVIILLFPRWVRGGKQLLDDKMASRRQPFAQEILVSPGRSMV